MFLSCDKYFKKIFYFKIILIFVKWSVKIFLLVQIKFYEILELYQNMNYYWVEQNESLE